MADTLSIKHTQAPSSRIIVEKCTWLQRVYHHERRMEKPAHNLRQLLAPFPRGRHKERPSAALNLFDLIRQL